MWNIFTNIILIMEALLLLGFVVGKCYKKKLNETALFIAVVFVVNLSLHLVPFFYNIIELGEKTNIAFGLLDCFGATMKLFVGDPSVGDVIGFCNDYGLFTVAYMLGILIALLTTISTAIEAFSNSITNAFRLAKAFKKESCDIVVGNSPKTIHYAKTCNAVLLVDDSVSKETVNELIENGYVVLRKGFTEQMLSGRQFRASTRYNVICADSQKALDYIDAFIAYKKTEAKVKHIYLYVELEGAKAETVRREIIEKNGMEAYIDTFSTDELLARTFIEENPITKFLPNTYLEDAAIKQGTEINVFLLGFNKLGQELYRQSILNNQLVTFDGEYKELPVHYYLCDTGIDAAQWNIGGLAEELSGSNAAEYFPLPELPFKATVIDKAPASHQVLTAIKKQVQKDHSYTLVIIGTDEDCLNIEIGAKLKSLLFDAHNYHLFVRSQATYTEDDAVTTYFGKSNSVFNHDIIVNDGLSVMAKKLHEVYAAKYAGAEERNRSDFVEYIREKAEKEWKGFDYFTLHSNIYSAMNLRVKLNLLGLDYKKDGNGANVSQISERLEHKGKYDYSEYFTPSVRNALLAQEHARWNAYHLLSEWMPLGKSDITIKSDEGRIIRFHVKNMAARKHACLTTFNGLNDLSVYLAKKACNGCTAADYDYYIYDEMLIISAEELLASLGYSVIEK